LDGYVAGIVIRNLKETSSQKNSRKDTLTKATLRR